MGCYYVKGTKFFVENYKKALEMDSGDGRTALGLYFMPLNYTLKSG